MATQFSVIEGLHLGKILLRWMLYLIVFAIFFIKIREQSLATKLIVDLTTTLLNKTKITIYLEISSLNFMGFTFLIHMSNFVPIGYYLLWTKIRYSILGAIP